jgi:hypothetical protein
MVRLTGIEPVRPHEHQILSLRRLPISPQSRCLVSVGRIELPLHAPKARVIPFHYTELTWLRRQDSNLRSPAYETGGDDRTPLLRDLLLVDRRRIELLLEACKATVLPLSLSAHIRTHSFPAFGKHACSLG